MSSFMTPLILEFGDGHEWRLVQGFRYDTALVPEGSIFVPAGFETDFASVPRVFWSIFPPSGGRYSKAAVLHDFLYRKSGVQRDVADKIFLEAMEVLGVSWLTRHIIYRAVRMFGGGAYQPKVFASVLLLLLAGATLRAGDDEAYHTLTLKQAQTTTWTHVCVSGPVVYARKQADGDEHITLDDGVNRLVLEIVPEYPLPVPAKGQRITACGIYRWDKRHNWPELHPVWKWHV